MKQATLKYDDVKGFILIDESENFIMKVDAGDNDEEVDWELIEKQANKEGYTLEQKEGIKTNKINENAVLEIAMDYKKELGGTPKLATKVHEIEGFALYKVTLENDDIKALLANDSEVWAENWDNKFFNEPCFDNGEITFPE